MNNLKKIQNFNLENDMSNFDVLKESDFVDMYRILFVAREILSYLYLTQDDFSCTLNYCGSMLLTEAMKHLDENLILRSNLPENFFNKKENTK